LGKRAVEEKLRRHKGDIMSPEKRSALMSRIKGKNTLPERVIAEALATLGLTWEAHAGDLPGRPDFVFREAKVAIFVDGDFWHGWRFSLWQDKLTEAWELKITGNRARDKRNHRKLRRMGWAVIRIWEHQIRKDLPKAISRLCAVLIDGPGKD
jgi:DNA mismatch endonuclease (patch repair protein)